MTLIAEYAEGMPCWIDASVNTNEQREALIDFYSSLFGWTFETEGPETGFYSIAHSDGHPVLAIGQQDDGQGHWVTYFSTKDIDQAAKRAKENGGNVFMGPMKVMDVGSTALVLDPTGAVYGLWQPETFPGFGVMYESNSPGWFDHVSEDAAGASRYYEKVLGNGVEHHDEGEMRILKRGDQWFSSLSNIDNLSQTPQWTPVIVVDSLDRIKEKVRKLGGTIIVEEMPVPGSAISIFQDPVMGTYLTVMAAGSNQASGD